jgi:uroporphyrinogen-III decarboxylase
VRLHICGRTARIVEGMSRLGCEIVDLDFFTDLGPAREKAGSSQVFLGNIAPVGVLRNQSAAEVSAAVAACHQAAGPRFIVGAGCEIPRETTEANVRAKCAYAHGHRP